MLKNPDIYLEQGITDFEFYLYLKQGGLENRELFKSYEKKKCVTCDSKYNVHGHHIFKQSKFRLDRHYNLEPMCNKCHGLLHNYPSQFIKKFGADKYESLTNWESVMEEFIKEMKENTNE